MGSPYETEKIVPVRPEVTQVRFFRILRAPQTGEEIIKYIEIFYNWQRKQARLGYLSPAAFTQRY